VEPDLDLEQHKKVGSVRINHSGSTTLLSCYLSLNVNVYKANKFFHPGSPIQGQKDSGSRIRIRNKELSVFNPKTVSKVSDDLRCSSRIPDPDFLPIPDPGIKKSTRTRIYNIVKKYKSTLLEMLSDK
jgi:hypothetical protein